MKKLSLLLMLLMATTSIGVQAGRGVVTGRVLKEGAPAVGVRVWALESADARNATERIAGFGETDAAGRYRIESLAPGRYVIAGGLLDTPTFYPGAANRIDALGVVVTDSGVVTGIDFSITPLSAGLTVSGRLRSLTGTDGAPLTGVTLTPSPAGRPAVTAPINADGSFTFFKVVPGTYDINVVESRAAASFREFGFVPPPPIVDISGNAGEALSENGRIRVVDRDLTGLALLIPPQATMRIDLHVEGLAIPPADAGRRIFGTDCSRPSPVNMTFTPVRNGKGATGPISRTPEAVRLIAGDYRVDLSGLPAGFKVKSIALDSAKPQSDLLTVVAGAKSTLVVTLEAASFKVGGRFIGAPPGLTKAVLLEGSVFIPQRVACPNSSSGTFSGGLDFGATADLRSDGSFEFAKVPAGKHSIHFDPEALMSMGLSLRIPGAAPNGSFLFRTALHNIPVADRDVAGIEIVFPPVVRVTGRVVLDGGGPLPPVSLSFSSANPSGGEGYGIDTATSDGQFSVLLREAAHRIEVGNLAPAYTVKSIVAGSTTLPMNNRRIATLNVAKGAPSDVVVTLGLASTPPRGGRVSGRIIGLENLVASRGAAGNPSEPFHVTLYRAPNAPISQMPSAIVGADGSFQFPLTQQGTYRVHVSPAPDTLPISEILVPQTDLSDVRVVIPKMKEVSGHAEVEGNGPMPRLRFGLMAGQPVNAKLLAATDLGTPSTDGAFKITLPETEFWLRLDVPSGYSLEAMTYGDVDLRNNPLKLSAGNPANLQLKFKRNNKTWFGVSGTVRGPIDPSNMKVALTPITQLGPPYPTAALNASLNDRFADQIRSSPPSFLENPVAVIAQVSQTAAVKPDGTFEFPGALPGIYVARVVMTRESALMPGALVEVADRDVSGVQIEAPVHQRITARISVEGNGPVPRVSIRLNARNAVYFCAFSVGNLCGQASTKSDTANVYSVDRADGASAAFQALLPVGEYRAEIVAEDLPAGYSVRTFSYGDTDLLQKPLVITVGELAELRIGFRVER